MRLMRKIQHSRLGSAVANRVGRVKRSAPVEEYLARDLPAATSVPMEARDAVPMAAHARELLQTHGAALLGAGLRYYRGHRALVFGVAAGAALLALAGWARHRKSI